MVFLSSSVPSSVTVPQTSWEALTTAAGGGHWVFRAWLSKQVITAAFVHESSV